MAEPLADRIIEKITEAGDLYHRLLLVVALSGKGKTTTLQIVQKRMGLPMLNVNLELSRIMLELTERQRALKLSELLSDVVNTTTGDIILLDNIEILFDITLKQDPLRLLQWLSRNKTLVATWNGSIKFDQLTYAEPDHPEYRSYEVRDFLAAKSEAFECG
jgi:hypothetical protein